MMKRKAAAPRINTRIGLGMMSGTSCDGIDLALCLFPEEGGYEILRFEGFAYSPAFRQKLLTVMSLKGEELLKFEDEFTILVATAVQTFLAKAEAMPGFIAAHGHTVFHQPLQSFTYQMLNGALLSAKCNLPVVCDFRRQDVAVGGQGAPLVPIGDRILFAQYRACLNLGGVANVSFTTQEPMLAFDVGPANLILNHIAAQLGHAFDEGGKLARQGSVNKELLEQLNALSYYQLTGAKSLGREWFEATLFPLFDQSKLGFTDKLATAVEHIALQVSQTLSGLNDKDQVLVTGGGAYNDFLIKQIQHYCGCDIVLPSPELIEGKEALIFALIGKLRLEGQPNVIAAATGATQTVCAGAVYLVL
jgi:anhydro-N-acetylmuramic acid kinase